MSSMYEKLGICSNGRLVEIVLQGAQGCADLVALYNIITLKYLSGCGEPGPVHEKFLQSILSDALEQCIPQVEEISPAQAREVRRVLSKIRTDFSLQPRLSAHKDFVPNASFMLCRILGLTVVHGWVIDPEVTSYDSLNEYSHEDLLEHIRGEGQNDKVCSVLLDDFKTQLTSYGFNSLPNELTDDTLALLYWRNRLNIIHKHCDIVYIYVTDEDIRKQMPEAVWMLLEECQETNIYFTEKYTPVKGQPCEKEAREWYKRFLQTQMKKKKDESQMDDHGQKKDESQMDDHKKSESQMDDHSQKKDESQMRDKNQKKDKGQKRDKIQKKDAIKNKDKIESRQSSQQGLSHAIAPESSEPREATGDDGETAGSGGGDKSSDGDDERIEAPGSYESVPPTPEADNVPQDVTSEFLTFLNDFKDDGKHYFKGIVAAFTSHCLLFYVPYDFIVAHDELLALNIQDNYTRISEELKKSVVLYLSENKVNYPDAVLKIIGLPEPKSVQLFLDFLGGIELHEHYVVYGADPEALPSYDSRRMSLGYLKSIVAKFRTGRCWGGEWSEPNMKVKNKGSEFVIDFEKDYELTPDLGFLDLRKFCETVLDRLKFNGRFPLYFDELMDDMLLINDCFGKPGKWERFLELISYPLALKPPLVRASYVCEVYIAGLANSTGSPPRYSPLFRSEGCFNWRIKASKHPLLKKVYEHQNDRKTKKLKYIIDDWTAKHWHVFQFSRHFIQHGLEHTKGDNLIQKVKDISELDILLSRTIWKAIAKSFRFLVLNCGVDGIFSSAWRHYAGSDYVDKPNGNLEAATTGDMVQGLLNSICDDERTGYVYTELSAYSQSQHRSIIFTDADLTELGTKLNYNNFKFEVDDRGRLCCGSIVIWKHDYPAEEGSDDSQTAIVVEGPYAVEYDAVYVFLTEWDGFVMSLVVTIEKKADEDPSGVLQPD